MADATEVEQNYRDLSASTGESLSSIAARLEENAGDVATAASLRALAASRESAPVDRSAAPVEQVTAAAEGSEFVTA